MEERRGLRVTTWNVNGMRNPFGYEPWRQDRTFAAMFDILEADIVVMQETKIQKKDLRDDMVLVPGWDVYFSLPRHKKGTGIFLRYSGVAIYTRTAVCAPIRAEEGITGVLTPPNSSKCFYDLPGDQAIGGYPTVRQLSCYSLDAATLDSEGRCVVLEFPAFVLIGVYSPANRDETRDEFRMGFLNALDARVRNLVAAGKRVLLTGDLNIIREEIDTANVEEQLKKQGITREEYISVPARRMLNQLLVDGKVIGDRDAGREEPILWDICRSFYPSRQGMFTCWDQKINARPGNFGSRIDYVLFSEDWKSWFCESNIQEGLMGSDHCPVYAVLKERVHIDGKEVYIKDIMSACMFKDGKRQREWSTKDLLQMSAKLMPEFDRRRNIREMFNGKPSLPLGEAETPFLSNYALDNTQEPKALQHGNPSESKVSFTSKSLLKTTESISDVAAASESHGSSTSASINRNAKRPSGNQPFTVPPPKHRKSGAVSKLTPMAAKGQPKKGQSSLTCFFKPQAPTAEFQNSSANGEKTSQSSSMFDAESDPTSMSISISQPDPPTPAGVGLDPLESRMGYHDTSPKFELNCDVNEGNIKLQLDAPIAESIGGSPLQTQNRGVPCSRRFNPADEQTVVDPIVAKESWSKLLGQRVVPRCEHNEPCVSYVTKKSGINCGRSFYLCPRPLGPTGRKEKNSHWRCQTFIWSSDWNGDET